MRMRMLGNYKLKGNTTNYRRNRISYKQHISICIFHSSIRKHFTMVVHSFSTRVVAIELQRYSCEINKQYYYNL